MSERLIIRLASEAAQKLHWLIWSESEKEIIASGDLDNAEQLNKLTEKAATRQVICLLPGVDVVTREVPIKGAFNRQMQQALPYIMEEELATDVDKLHFTVIAKDSELVHVALCDKRCMSNWLTWLAEAKINCRQFIPEGFALPSPEQGNWQALQIDEQWIVRESEHCAWSCEANMLDLILASKIAQDSPQVIQSYTPISESALGVWLNDSPSLPMAKLAVGAINCKINLLSGDFKVKKEVNVNLLKWRLPVVFATLLFIVSCVNLYLENRNVASQVDAVKAQVEEVYQIAFPNQSKLAYSRIKRKMTSMLSEIGGTNHSADFLVMLDEISPGFERNKTLKINTLKYEQSRQEMRILALGNDFQAFEKFSSQLPKQYNLQQGALNSSKSEVSGLLTIRKD